MSQQELVLVLNAQGKSATTIHQHLVEAFGELAISYPTVSRTIRSLSCNPIDDESQNFGGRPLNQLTDARIRKILDDNPVASVREIVHAASIPASMVWYVLTTRLGYTWRKCRIVPHALSNIQRQQRRDRVSSFWSTCARRSAMPGAFCEQVTSPGSSITLHIRNSGCLRMWIPRKWRDG
jgi:DNA recombination-dependent growth factor C